MGQQQSKDELLYQQVSYGNSEGIKALCREGAGLEWIDKEAKTPLIVACMSPELHNVARTLIELGANVNAYRPGRHAGTPLHHAAKRGLENNVKLLLSHGANPLIMNDDCQSPLDVARAKGHSNVVRTIESHICLFSGWLREFHGPGFLEVLAPQLVSRRVWAVILPCGARNLARPLKLELAIYPTLQDAQPRIVVPLWRASLEETKSQHSDPSVMIVDNAAKTRLKLASGNENDKEQLLWFCNACKGIPTVMHPAFMNGNQGSGASATAPPDTEDVELDMAINASIQSSTQGRPPFPDPSPSSKASASSSHTGPVAPTTTHSTKLGTNDSEEHEAGQSSNSNEHPEIQTNTIPSDSVPSAPPVANDILDDGAIHYPSIDSSPIDLRPGEGKEEASSSSCVICLDAPIEGACIPCGHMAGCMNCLTEIKSKKWGCPVCRAKIDQVVRLYAV
ncbi:putative E3 ubiquitin-protein ligase XBAT35 [Cucurbita pepo subsp. pepo]|uniref:putative E3 ubiquitin-protein ligase XBAT35 n=1 Tax=Cucurbita pepo subsp. pepo TaxID=3664 RepID=UPI000C9D7795|nr:putative E3 ubiquitin-protein ligase XBAT35 [Cucurbita pepo subsp. pepo]XP_023521276.1 putative E3 ubiquitin-protein ligase XBAT35 [Cucurbita pepo subsp. pepo]XP_023540860.1 putative E3 ubiquitin-protein ligase XBAT35 [Cucurbita pepo subsp. pepo]XP_023540861.1 putative E3 ubiquitin-protein ligase XBAT35 [Cucurbita pepo subsp. pepo]